MISHNIRDYKEVANIIHAYQSKPEKVLEKMGLMGGEYVVQGS